MIRIRRYNQAPAEDEGLRVLVDRLWPRGLRKEEAHIDLWLTEVSPIGGLAALVRARPREMG